MVSANHALSNSALGEERKMWSNVSKETTQYSNVTGTDLGCVQIHNCTVQLKLHRYRWSRNQSQCKPNFDRDRNWILYNVNVALFCLVVLSILNDLIAASFMNFSLDKHCKSC